MINSAVTRGASVGPLTPRRGNTVTRAIGRMLLRLFGWRMVGEPPNAAKFVVSAAPHTSNWDGALFLWGALALGMDLRFIAKHSLFRGPLGRFLAWMGGVPIDRSDAGGIVGSAVHRFEEAEKLVLVIAPEGTRKPTPEWKTGLHRIALGAGVPIALGFVDYGTKTLGFGPWFIPGPDVDGDLQKMAEFYQAIVPRHPERFTLPRPRRPGD